MASSFDIHDPLRIFLVQIVEKTISGFGIAVAPAIVRVHPRHRLPVCWLALRPRHPAFDRVQIVGSCESGTLDKPGCLLQLLGARTF